MNIKILNRWNESVLFEGDYSSLRECVIGANLRGANLRDADLGGADLRDANLRGADLGGANLRDANLRDANLGGANLRGANLRGANLRGANLRGANLRGADLRDANLRDANLGGADLGIPFTPDPELINKVAAAALAKDDSLKMDNWHTCATTHCIAGWAVTLHPEGKLLERFTSTYLVGRLLLGDEAAGHFFDSNEDARAYLEGFLK